MLRLNSHDREKLVDPLYRTYWQYWALVIVLSLVVFWGVMEYIEQVKQGLGTTGMQRPVFWGIYMTNFIFFIGLSLAGTFISAVLRLVGAEWRRPITRMAEAVTVFALINATIQIIIDMGRPDRLIYVIMYGRLQSPILWDVFIVNLYLLGSLFYLYLPLIPDAAILRDNIPEDAAPWRSIFYRILAMGWRGNREQWRRLEKIISIMALFIIPVAISVHTITSWLLATTVQPGWHSTVFGPYFVVTAIFSGIGGLFLVMSIVRWVFGLQEYITLKQYHYLGLLFVTMAIVWGYFTYTETLVLVAAQQTMEFPVLASKLWGTHALSFWVMIGLISFSFWMIAAPLLMPSFLINIQILKPPFTFGVALAAGSVAFLTTEQTAVPFDRSLLPDDPVFSTGLAAIAVISALIGAAVWSKTHPVRGAFVAGVCVLLGTWLERWNIVVPTVTHPRLIYYSSYSPTQTEIVLTIASGALLLLAMIVFFKLFPAVSLWEVQEGEIIESAQSKIEIPLPEPSDSGPKKRRWGFG